MLNLSKIEFFLQSVKSKLNSKKHIDKRKNVCYNSVTKLREEINNMCTEYLMTIYNALDSLTTDEYNELMQEMESDNDENKDAE